MIAEHPEFDRLWKIVNDKIPQTCAEWHLFFVI